MNHRKESELIAYFYSDSPQQEEDRRHLESCGECSAAYEALKQDIAVMVADIDRDPIPARSEAYGEEVWRSIRPSLIPFKNRPANWLRLVPPTRTRLIWAIASAAAVLALVAFFSGRLWEQKISSRQASSQASSSSPQGKLAGQQTTVQPVIVVLLSDHLERSERLLVELNHPDEAIVDPALQATARQLLAENRRYRQAATEAETKLADGKSQSNSGAKPQGKNNEVEISPAMTLALDDLDRVLTKVADQPDGLSRAEIAQVKQQINASGLLFEVRILRSRTRHTPTGAQTARRDGIA